MSSFLLDYFPQISVCEGIQGPDDSYWNRNVNVDFTS